VAFEGEGHKGLVRDSGPDFVLFVGVGEFALVFEAGRDLAGERGGMGWGSFERQRCQALVRKRLGWQPVKWPRR